MAVICETCKNCKTCRIPEEARVLKTWCEKYVYSSKLDKESKSNRKK